MNELTKILIGCVLGILGFFCSYIGVFAFGYAVSEQQVIWLYLFIYSLVVFAPLLSSIFFYSSLAYVSYCASLFLIFSVFSYSDLVVKANSNAFDIPEFANFYQGLLSMIKVNFWGANILILIIFISLMMHAYAKRTT